MLGEEDVMPEVGTQDFDGGQWVASDVYAETLRQKAAGKAWWWHCVYVVQVAQGRQTDAGRKLICQLQCKLCKKFLFPSNPSDSCRHHLKSTACSQFREGVRLQLIPPAVSAAAGVQQQQSQAAGSSLPSPHHSSAISGLTGSNQVSTGSNKRQALALPDGQQRLSDPAGGGGRDTARLSLHSSPCNPVSTLKL